MAKEDMIMELFIKFLSIVIISGLVGLVVVEIAGCDGGGVSSGAKGFCIEWAGDTMCNQSNTVEEDK